MDDRLKTDLLRYLREGREALVWKCEGLSDYDVRRPLTPTGTNLLGLIKHLTGIEAEYFGMVFDRPIGMSATRTSCASWSTAASAIARAQITWPR